MKEQVLNFIIAKEMFGMYMALGLIILAVIVLGIYIFTRLIGFMWKKIQEWFNV